MITSVTKYSWCVAVFVVCAAVASCRKFLNVSPNSAITISADSEQKIAELLAGAYPQASYFAFLEARTDNVEPRTRGTHSAMNEAMYYWEDYDQEDLDAPLHYWNSCYTGIAQANQALELLRKRPLNNRVRALYAEAFLLRAYLHFMLVNIWAKPYSAKSARTDLAIPFVTKPEKNALVRYERGTVAEVYDKIERDLRRGLSFVADDYYDHPKFHFNKKAAYAFASRFYLMKGQWDSVIQCADFVLGLDEKLVIRNWGRDYSKNTIPFGTSLFRKYTSADEPCNLLLTATESRIHRNLPSDLYGFTQDLEERIFYNQGVEGCQPARSLRLSSLYRFVYPSTSIAYIAKYDELALLGSTGVRPRNVFVTNVLLSTDEVLLNRIEAYAMKRDYERAYFGVVNYLKGKFGIDLPCEVNQLTLVNSKHYGTYSPFYGLSTKQLAYVKLIAELRQKEFVHEGLRWFDIRRFHMPLKRVSAAANYRPLLKDDPRKVLQIPQEAIRRGLQPNAR